MQSQLSPFQFHSEKGKPSECTPVFGVQTSQSILFGLFVYSNFSNFRAPFALISPVIQISKGRILEFISKKSKTAVKFGSNKERMEKFYTEELINLVKLAWL